VILTALYDYITTPQRSTDGVRNRARRIVRHYVGNEIYTGVRPQQQYNHVIVLAVSGGEPVPSLRDIQQETMAEVDVELYSVNRDRYEIAEALKQLFHQYAGVLNEDYSTQGIFLRSDPYEDAIEPLGAGQDWLHRITIPLTVEHNQTLPTFNAGSFITTVEQDNPGDPTDDGVLLIDSLSWTPDDDAIAVSDGAAINGHAWRVGENDNISEQIFASAKAAATTYSIYVRYRHTGVNPGDATLTLDGEAFAITSNGSSNTYDGASTVRGTDGWALVGTKALTAGVKELIIDGPTTASDAVIVDRVALVP
jgi:hypothetical protein